MRNLILTLFLILSALVKPAFAATAEFSQNIPEILQKARQESPIVYTEISAPQAITPLRSGYWSDSASGPGTLAYQYEPYKSGILSGYGSGFITNINYHWRGDLKGWQNVKVYLCLNGKTDCADVSNVPTGSIQVPYGVFSSSSSIQFYFWVDQAPKLRIYGGPSFSYVSASVEYQ